MEIDLNVFLTLVLAGVLLVLPGYLLGLAAGLRGWTAAGAAPVVTFAPVLVGILLCTATGLPWGFAAFIGVVVLLGALLVGLRLLRARRSGEPITWPGTRGTRRAPGRVWHLLTLASVAVGGAVGAWTVLRGTSNLGGRNTGFDALHHVNSVQYILATGEVSPVSLGALNGFTDGSFTYPDAFHALAALVAAGPLGSVEALNALLACVPFAAALGLAGLLWSLGLPRLAVATPIVLAATTGYPYDLMWRGPIWVYAFGIALIPAFLVLLRATVRRLSLPVALLLALSAGGLILVHPSAALSAGFFAGALMLQRWWTRRTGVLRDLAVLVPAMLVALLFTVPLIGAAIVASEGGSIVDWPAVQSPGAALGEMVAYNYDTPRPQLWLAGLAIVGLALAFRVRSLRWWTATTFAFLALTVWVASYDGGLVERLTGPWWNDRFRFEGLAYLGLAPIAALGLVTVADLVAGAVSTVRRRSGGTRTGSPSRRRAGVAGLVVAAAVFAVLTGGLYITPNVARMQIAYAFGTGGSYTAANVAAFEELARLEDDDIVVNDPNDGSAWMWSSVGVRPAFGAPMPTPSVPPLPDDRAIIVDRLNCLDSDQEVRDAVAALGAEYVMKASATISGAERTKHVGFRDLGNVESLTKVWSQGGAAIYRIEPQPLVPEDQDDACTAWAEAREGLE